MDLLGVMLFFSGCVHKSTSYWTHNVHIDIPEVWLHCEYYMYTRLQVNFRPDNIISILHGFWPMEYGLLTSWMWRYEHRFNIWCIYCCQLFVLVYNSFNSCYSKTKWSEQGLAVLRVSCCKIFDLSYPHHEQLG